MNPTRPAVSVITPVDYDHLELLGSDLGKIAWEKAGIIKSGRPVVVARQRDAALAVIESEAETLNAPLTLMGRDVDGWEERGRLVVQLQDRLLDLPAPRLPGAHQFANAALAIVALHAFGDPRIDETAIAAGVESADWPGRFQRLDRGPVAALAPDTDIWLDGAHNPHAAQALAETCLRLSARDARPVALVTGMLGRKDAHAFFAAFRALGPHVFVTDFDSPMATPAEVLADAARASGLTVEVVDGVAAGVSRASKLPGPPHIVICGSLHFVGDVLAMSPETWPD